MDAGVNFYEVVLVLTTKHFSSGAEPCKGLLHSSCAVRWKETSPTDLMDILRKHNIGFIVLAGFLKAYSQSNVDVFSQRIINLHPLPFAKSMEGGNAWAQCTPSGF